ncbi:MAG: DUF2505 domain-containing protein [Xanthomonadales bacterium]|jgi:hypothetical protein|nr:DUF2505 domain-containing protein [Xanthomonadales bacterium]MDH3923009.1 DUF2505 domain-containing protein [Xanthomonadales bacterium]
MTIRTDFEQDAKAVFKAMTDPEFLTDRNLALGEISSEYEVSEGGDRTTLTAVREVRRELPGVLAKLFDPVSVMDITENWQAQGDGWTGEWYLQVREQPVTVTGQFQLVPSETGCSYSVTHRVRAKVPFVSGQIEKYVRTQTAKGANDELEYLRKYLG